KREPEGPAPTKVLPMQLRFGARTSALRRGGRAPMRRGHELPVGRGVARQHVRDMGDPLGQVYNAMSNELSWLHAKWNLYRQLYNMKSASNSENPVSDARDVLHDRDGAFTDERHRLSVGANAVARDAAGSVGGV